MMKLNTIINRRIDTRNVPNILFSFFSKTYDANCLSHEIFICMILHICCFWKDLPHFICTL